MTPLREQSLEEVGRIRKENEFQATRRNEIREFIQAGCKLAELQTSGTVSLDREIELYKRAIRKVGYASLKETHKKLTDTYANRVETAYIDEIRNLKPGSPTPAKGTLKGKQREEFASFAAECREIARNAVNEWAAGKSMDAV